jgi:16S rRNA (guanine966-N2)-methyltransferase
MKDGGIIIIHRHKKDDVEITSNFNILVTRNYGISKIMIGN